jgi:hypothetical protein
MCASTLTRILRGVLAGVMFYFAGERFLTAGFSVPPLLLSLVGVLLVWQAFSGAG